MSVTYRIDCTNCSLNQKSGIPHGQKSGIPHGQKSGIPHVRWLTGIASKWRRREACARSFLEKVLKGPKIGEGVNESKRRSSVLIKDRCSRKWWGQVSVINIAYLMISQTNIPHVKTRYAWQVGYGQRKSIQLIPARALAVCKKFVEVGLPQTQIFFHWLTMTFTITKSTEWAKESLALQL